MTARPCLGCAKPVRCRGRFVFCDGCWRLAHRVFNREPYADLIERSRASNAFFTDLGALIGAITAERAARVAVGA